MQNKQLIEGIITNKPTLSKFGSTLIFLKHSYKKQDGSEGSSRYRCEAKGSIAQEIATNYDQNQFVQVVGISRDTKAKKKNEEGTWVELVDQFGDQVWEKYIWITAIKKMGEAAMTKKPIEERMGFKPAPHIPPTLPKQPTPVFKKNVNAPQANVIQNIDENPFGYDELPF